MSKFRSRKLKGGQPQMNTPPVKPPPQPAPQPATPLKPPPNPVKTPPPGVGAAAKTLEKAEEGISFFEQYGYQLAIGFIVLLIIGIIVIKAFLIFLCLRYLANLYRLNELAGSFPCVPPTISMLYELVVLIP